MFEYLLIDGMNDRPEDANNLAKFMKSSLYHVNLIKYHDTGGDFNPSSKLRRDKFFDTLKKLGVSVTFRVSFGEDILAACGQLAGKNTIKTKNLAMLITFLDFIFKKPIIKTLCHLKIFAQAKKEEQNKEREDQETPPEYTLKSIFEQ